jgi:hypothetical protein
VHCPEFFLKSFFGFVGLFASLGFRLSGFNLARDRCEDRIILRDIDGASDSS